VQSRRSCQCGRWCPHRHTGPCSGRGRKQQHQGGTPGNTAALHTIRDTIIRDSVAFSYQHVPFLCPASLRQPDDLGHPQAALKHLLYLVLAHGRVAVGVEQALLRGQQRAAVNEPQQQQQQQQQQQLSRGALLVQGRTQAWLTLLLYDARHRTIVAAMRMQAVRLQHVPKRATCSARKHPPAAPCCPPLSGPTYPSPSVCMLPPSRIMSRLM
jgi:hypothetical protein